MTTDVVLIGGGHSHAIALKLWGMNPLSGIRITLISDVIHTPYSGMLPGYVAGFYSFDETHINLPSLARFAGAEFYCDRAIGLDLSNNKVICYNHPGIAFDLLSIDIGSTPSTKSVIGAAEYAIPAKPVPGFLAAWSQILERVSQQPEKPLIIAIVGGGAGGVELALNMQGQLHTILQEVQQPLENISLHLFHRGSQLLPHHNAWVGQRLQRILLERDIILHLEENVKEILSDLAEKDFYKIICDSGLEIAANKIIWVTQASAPSWIKASGLATDSRGFILVKDTLQSTSHPHIFAAGDIATMENYSPPKAGVFAVRQGKPLLENLQRLILGKPLKPYIPQKHYLSLIGTGDKNAIASWSVFGWQSPLLWYWKDYIDRQFMRRFY
jgi:selenide,water dikinase